MTALLLYDYLLTFQLELRYVWTKKLNTVKLLFILNRYTILVFQLVLILSYFIKPITNTVRFFLSYYCYV